MPVLTGIDILGIQRYVFASNRLRDVLAASWMVDHVMRREAGSLLQWGMTDERVLLAAGGNAMVEFEDLGAAQAWTRQYTRWLQDEAPGLEVVVAHRPYEDRRLAWALKAIAVDLARAKLERQPSVPQLGLSVTASCSVTGLPATSIDRDQTLLSRPIETLRQESVQQSARERWRSFLPESLAQASGWRGSFPDDLDQMGRSHGETSLLGVVHIDGNGVGKAISEWLGRCVENEVANNQVRTQYREWSDDIAALGEQVLDKTIGRIAGCICEERSVQGERACYIRGTLYPSGFRLYAKNGQEVLLPLRPILLGGDDLTFVCDGRIALDLAVTALREFESQPIPHLGQDGCKRQLTACAGVVLVKAHAPFHRSYELAEGLCASAKRARQEQKEKRGDTGCWLDWQVGSTRPGEAVEGLRTRANQGGKLTMRPYPLREFDGRAQSWDWLDTKLLGPGSTPKTAEQGFRGAACWTGSRSRVKRLGALVPDGKDAISRQIEAWSAIETGIQLPAGLPEGGFIEDRTPLLDAIELLDLHIRLEPDPREANRSAPATKEGTS